jgi:hypothetical protein
MNFKEESLYKIVLFGYYFTAKLMAIRLFDARHSICRLLMNKNPNFQRFAVFHVREIFIRPFPDLVSLDVSRGFGLI